MKLIDLLESVTIQGDVRLSVWDEDDEEIAVCEIDGICDTLREYDLEKEGMILDLTGRGTYVKDWVNYDVTYIFTANDGYLHIELRKELNAE